MRVERNWLLGLVLACGIAAVVSLTFGSPFSKWEDYVWVGTTTLWAFYWWQADRRAARR